MTLFNRRSHASGNPEIRSAPQIPACAPKEVPLGCAGMTWRTVMAGLLLALALPASAAFDIGQLMDDLARHKGGKAKFVEKKYFAILDKDILSIERDKQKLSINLANQPEALAFVDSIRGTLSGNRAALEKNYALHLAGNTDKWVLTLLPSDQKIANMVQRITVTGNKNQVRIIEYLQADGDRSVLNIDPVESK